MSKSPTDNELCTCGHTRAEHSQRFAHCLQSCTCKRFTWDARNAANIALLEKARDAQKRGMS